jgi:hypothetical protein
MRPALAVDGEAQLGVVRLAITEFGACLGLRRLVRTARAEREAAGLVPAFARRSAFFWIIAGHDTHL